MAGKPIFLEYVPKVFRGERLEAVERVNAILESYHAQGYDLTLRQVYYQFVARGWIPNRDTEYKRLGSLINDARLSGLVPWNRIVDRTRNLRGIYHYDDPEHAITDAADGYATDLWADQDYRVEVWVEKDALVEPAVLAGLIEEAVFAVRDVDRWAEAHAKQERERELLTIVGDRWQDVADYLEEV